MEDSAIASSGRNFFGEDSPYLAHPLLTEERTDREIDYIEELVGPLVGPVLDLGCGFGRHSIALARRGLTVLGVDPSDTMIAEAKRRASKSGVSVDFRQLGAEAVDGERRFALAICLFTSFGQWNPAAVSPTGASTRGLLASTRQVLNVGAPLIIEVPEFERSHELLVREEQLGPTQVTREIDDKGLVTEVFDGPDGVFHLGYQAFRPDALQQLLEERGFEVEQLLNHGLVEPPGHLQTVVARNSG